MKKKLEEYIFTRIFWMKPDLINFLYFKVWCLLIEIVCSKLKIFKYHIYKIIILIKVQSSLRY